LNIIFGEVFIQIFNPLKKLVVGHFLTVEFKSSSYALDTILFIRNACCWYFW
jgi:hypothetical protein